MECVKSIDGVCRTTSDLSQCIWIQNVKNGVTLANYVTGRERFVGRAELLKYQAVGIIEYPAGFVSLWRPLQFRPGFVFTYSSEEYQFWSWAKIHIVRENSMEPYPDFMCSCYEYPLDTQGCIWYTREGEMSFRDVLLRRIFPTMEKSCWERSGEGSSFHLNCCFRQFDHDLMIKVSFPREWHTCVYDMYLAAQAFREDE